VTGGSAEQEPRVIVLFDGVCNLCNRTVNFVIDRDPRGRFRFAALQSDAARKLLHAHGRTLANPPSSILLLENGRWYEESAAALRIARGLRGLWKLAFAAIAVPRPLRDALYRFIARRRYRWFGTAEQCRVPTPELRERFL
jgi:predicted DCC family thiol-disulfide oxidoreductase YuxK